MVVAHQLCCELVIQVDGLMNLYLFVAGWEEFCFREQLFIRQQLV